VIDYIDGDCVGIISVLVLMDLVYVYDSVDWFIIVVVGICDGIVVLVVMVGVYIYDVFGC